MPRRKVALSGLLAFGAGVAVGANWPRAGNFLGCLLQRLGFELTDLTLWMWDPEKPMIQEAKSKRAAVRKRARRPQLPEKDPFQTRRRQRAKTRSHSRRISPGSDVLNATDKTKADAAERWIYNSRLNQSPNNANRVSPVKSSTKSISRIETAHCDAGRARKKTNGATVNAGRGRKNPAAGNGKKAKVFAGTVSSASAALN
jgi:hypothetical protein